MKSMKNKVFLILIYSVVLTSVIFMVTLNVFIKSYIGNNAKKEISKQIDIMQNMDTYVEYYDADMEEEVGLFTVNSFSVDNDFMFSLEDGIEEYYYYLSKDDRAIQDYFEENPSLYEDEKIFSAKIDKQRYRIGTSTITWDNEYDDVLNEKLIFYINETPLYRVVYILNGLFLITLAVSLAGAVYAGLKAGKMIEGSELKLKKFFANASHELKTPLMSIQGYAEGLQKGVITDTEMATEVIIKQSDKMYALVDELLYLSKIESGDYVFSKNRINVNLFIEDCFSSVAGLATKCEINISLDCPQKEITILGDENQLQKAFMNIISNALRYANKNIYVSILEHTKSVEIWVEDDGIGIPEDDLPKIFERFYTGQKGNTGIGLSLAKEIISQHKGTIKAVNNDNGAKFIINLPLC